MENVSKLPGLPSGLGVFLNSYLFLLSHFPVAKCLLNIGKLYQITKLLYYSQSEHFVIVLKQQSDTNSNQTQQSVHVIRISQESFLEKTLIAFL